MPRYLSIRLRGLAVFLAAHPRNLEDLHEPGDPVTPDPEASADDSVVLVLGDE
ncbi:hypothetical protein FM113_07265 [Leucobacter sp. 7(1)]|nr:hypothetical protein FM113_07265 [Leucobacter sp. 7(1)]